MSANTSAAKETPIDPGRPLAHLHSRNRSRSPANAQHSRNDTACSSYPKAFKILQRSIPRLHGHPYTLTPKPQALKPTAPSSTPCPRRQRCLSQRVWPLGQEPSGCELLIAEGMDVGSFLH